MRSDVHGELENSGPDQRNSKYKGPEAGTSVAHLKSRKVTSMTWEWVRPKSKLEI